MTVAIIMQEDDPYNPSFQPSLPQCGIRSKVPSSGYATGQVAKQPNREVERTWEVPAPFVPELPEDKLREKVPSSGYGKVLIKIEKKEPVFEKPSFKPELPANDLRQKVSSSAYGKVVPTIVVKEKEPEGPFKPQLPPSDLRAKAPSSAYGKSPVRPKTAPPKPQNNDFTLDGIAYAKATAVSFPSDRYTLLKEAETEEEERGRSGSPIRTVAPTAEKLRQRAQSAGYGRVLAKSPSPKKPEAAKPYVVIKTPLADKVASSGYGSAPTKQGVKATPPASAPLWSPSKKAPAILDIPEAVKPKAYHHVAASGYGRVSPNKADVPLKEYAPKWTPSSAKVELGQPSPVKSSIYQHVRSSGYGSSSYSPVGAVLNHQQRYLEDGDEDNYQDDVDDN